MSDHIKGVTVVFDKDYKDYDADKIINAIKMIKGVQIVHPSIETSDDWINRAKIKADLKTKLMELDF